MTEKFAQHIFVVFRVACRAAIDEATAMRWRAGEFERRFSHRPPAYLCPVNFGEPLERPQLGVALTAILSCLANAGRNARRLQPLHAIVGVEFLGPLRNEGVEIVLVGNPRLEAGEACIRAPRFGARHMS